jgi:hypothetical protein
LHLSPAYAGSRFIMGLAAESLYAQALSLPSSCGLDGVEQGRVVSAIIAGAANLTP